MQKPIRKAYTGKHSSASPGYALAVGPESWRSVSVSTLMQKMAENDGRYLEVNFVALEATTRANTYASLKEPDGTVLTDEISRKVLDRVVLARFVFRDTSAGKKMIYRVTEKGRIWAKAKRSLTRSAAILPR